MKKNDALRWLYILIIAAVLAAPLLSAQAQGQTQGWQAAVNLSQAGASSQPKLVAVDANRWWAFWVDQFDGLRFSLYEKEKWGKPTLTAFQGGVQKLDKMPDLVSDGRGTVHAFWMDKAGGLWHSQLQIHTARWQAPELLSEKVAAFQAQADAQGNILIAFARTQHTERFPAGVYYERLALIGGWEIVRPVYQTIYYRTVTPEEAILQLAVGNDNSLYLIFNDPHKKETYTAYSRKDGAHWAVEPLASKTPIRFARLMALADGTVLRLWSEEGAGCALWQQAGLAGKDGKTAWSELQAVLPGLDACPAADRLVQVAEQGLYWIWGEGTADLRVTRWDAAAGQWSEARSLSASLPVEGREEKLALDGLQLAITKDRLIVAGVDSEQDIWTAFGPFDLLAGITQPESATAQPASRWLDAQDVALESGAAIQEAAGVYDGENQLHVVGVQQPAQGSQAMVYARLGAQGWSRPVVLQQAEADGVLRQPDLLVDQKHLLHLAWSGGSGGEIYYQRVPAQQAGSPGAWSAVRLISPAGRPAVGPAFGLDAFGSLYLAYALPVNEGRGVYLLSSDDGGENWSEPALVFNAAAENWLAVDHPDLAVGTGGALFAVWVRTGLNGAVSEGIYYAHSDDSGKTWSSPISMAGKGSDWPRLLIVQNRLELVYSDAASGRSWQRSLDIQGDRNAWSVPSSLAAVEGDQLPIRASMDAAGSLYLVGLDRAGQALHQAVYADGRWGSAEVQPVGADRDADRLLVAAVAPGGGRLGVLLALAPLPTQTAEAQQTATPTPEGGRPPLSGLIYVERSVDAVAGYQWPTAAARPVQKTTGTPAPAVTNTPLPSPTPPLADLPLPGTENKYQPLFIAGGMASVMVVGALAILLNRRKAP